MEPYAWRRRWRALGLAADRLLPVGYRFPAPPVEDLKAKIGGSIIVPGNGRWTFSEADREIVLDGALFAMSFVAETMPVQVTDTDMKEHLPDMASKLAVRRLGNESEYVGSFDMLLRVFANRSPTYRRYHCAEIAFDLKLTGASVNLGLNSPTIRNILSHGQAVFRAARRDPSNLIGRCAALAYLFRRPPSPTRDGRMHHGAWGFLLLDADEFLLWEPKSNRPAPCVQKIGTLIRDGETEEPEALPVVQVPARPRQRDRWVDLKECEIKSGWVTTLDFTKVFNPGGNQRKKNENNLKRLRKWLKDHGQSSEALGDWRQGSGNGGRPYKIARVSMLKQCFSEYR